MITGSYPLYYPLSSYLVARSVNCGKWSEFARSWKPKELAQIPCAENTTKSTSASYAVFSARQPRGTKPISPEKTIVVG